MELTIVSQRAPGLQISWAHCISYFSVAMIKYYKNTLIDGRVYVGFMDLVEEFLKAGLTWQQADSRKLDDHILNHTHETETEIKLKMGQSHKLSKSPLETYFLQQRYTSQRFHNIPQTAPSTGDQIFKYPNLWEVHFSSKPPHLCCGGFFQWCSCLWLIPALVSNLHPPVSNPNKLVDTQSWTLMNCFFALCWVNRCKCYVSWDHVLYNKHGDGCQGESLTDWNFQGYWFPRTDTFTRGSVTCLGNFYLDCFVLCCFVYMEVKPLESFRTREIKTISFFMAQTLC